MGWRFFFQCAICACVECLLTQYGESVTVCVLCFHMCPHAYACFAWITFACIFIFVISRTRMCMCVCVHNAYMCLYAYQHLRVYMHLDVHFCLHMAVFCLYGNVQVLNSLASSPKGNYSAADAVFIPRREYWAIWNCSYQSYWTIDLIAVRVWVHVSVKGA